MNTIYLRFDDEAQAKAVLSEFVNAEGAWFTASHDHALDPIGPLVLTHPVVDPETGEVVEPAVVDDRYHVNLRVKLEWPIPAEHVVVPENPRRVWA